MRHTLLLILFLLFSYSAFSQDVQDKIRLLVEDYVSQNDEKNVDSELLYDELYQLYEFPIHINEADADELSRLPFLNLRHINALLDYIQKHGQVKTIFELQGVYGFNRQLIEDISPFISFDIVEESDQRRPYFKHEILLRSTTVVEEQEGYVRPDSMSHYKGVPYSALLKYKGALGKDWSWHITAEQDRGEAWFEHAKVVDFMSSGIQYKGRGLVSNIILGDYRVRLGQGLIINNNFGYGKSSQVMDVLQKGQTLRRFTSTSEFDMFRGVASQLDFGQWDMLIGASSRKADATVEPDGSNNLIRSFSETGLHRTDSEVEKYKQARINDVLLQVSYTYNTLKLSGNFSGQHLSDTYHENDRLDNTLTPSYQSFFNTSVDYQWNLNDVMLFGEIAVDKNMNIAALQGLAFYPSSRVGMSLIYRNYSKSYYAMYGQAFGEGSSVCNEEGIYLGVNVLISRGWSLDAYYDLYRFPWLRYGISRPTTGYDLFLKPQFSISRELNMHWQFKYEEKEENFNDGSPNNTLINTQRANLRYHISAQLSEFISIQSRIASTHVLHLDDENGYLVFQDVKAKLLQEKLSLTLRYALFNTSSYESRIYAYESDVLYLSSTPSFYGRGSRAYLNGSYKMNESFTFYLKLAYLVNYDGRNMGSSLDEIDADHKTDIHLQLRIKL